MATQDHSSQLDLAGAKKQIETWTSSTPLDPVAHAIEVVLKATRSSETRSQLGDADFFKALLRVFEATSDDNGDLTKCIGNLVIDNGTN